MGKKQTLNINDEREVRLKKLADLQEAGIEPYPAQTTRKHTSEQALKKKHGAKVHVAGRILMKRAMGKLIFCTLKDESGVVQIVLKQDEMKKEDFKLFEKKIDGADIVGISGERFKTQKGEESILVKKWTVLSKALRPLPDKFHGLQDEEIRLRKRYLDFIAHPDLRDVFVRKARFWSSMREFLVKEGFLEVETPVLETTASGAEAEPFATHHNALDLDVVLRISMGELWQKRLMVAGFEKTFEIGRQFRNEGMSREHLQDYTQMEFYWAYADYTMGMDLVRRMFQHVMRETWGTLSFDLEGFGKIDFSGEWEQISYVDTIKKIAKIDVLAATEKEIKAVLKSFDITFEKHAGKGRLIDSLWKHCRKQIKGPVFLVDVPTVVSPLAKRKADNPDLTERYQLLAAGSELSNGYSELNDPVDQAARFEEQEKMREAGDAEAHAHDADFVEALEHGMPPTTGFGVSERLFAFLENKPIRECVMFPLMKPIHQDD